MDHEHNGLTWAGPISLVISGGTFLLYLIVWRHTETRERIDSLNREITTLKTENAVLTRENERLSQLLMRLNNNGRGK